MKKKELMKTQSTSFNRPAQMEVFGWNGDIDTLMTPKTLYIIISTF